MARCLNRSRNSRSLPGVGRYIAGAISSIVFGHRAPIVDGNVSRVLARLCNHDGRPGERSFDAWAWARAEELVGSAEDPAASNEAMMELGALVCTRHAPTCNTCPLSALCAARRAGSPEEIPPPRKVGPRKTVHHHSVLIEHEGAVLLLSSPGSGALGGWGAAHRRIAGVPSAFPSRRPSSGRCRGTSTDRLLRASDHPSRCHLPCPPRGIRPCSRGSGTHLAAARRPRQRRPLESASSCDRPS